MRQASLNMGLLQLAITSLSVLASYSTHRQTNSALQIINMDAQTKSEIIAEITTTVVKTIEQTVRESLKRTLFVNKTTDEAAKQIKSSPFLEFNDKGNKIRYEANSSIMDKKSTKQLVKQISKKIKIKRNTFGMPPPSLTKNSEIFNKPHQGYSGIRNNSKPQKICFARGQEGHFQYFCPNGRNCNNS